MTILKIYLALIFLLIPCYTYTEPTKENSMLETIVVTGGAGYIGSHIGYLLAQQGYHVILLDNLLYKQDTTPLSWATLNINDYGDAKVLNDLFTTHNVKAIMHCAGYIEVGRSVNDPHDFYENNVVKTITLLDRMRAHNVPYMVFSSSCAVYGIPYEVPIPEEHPYNPISPYGKTKRMIEMILEDYDHAYGIKHVSLRYFNAAGALAEKSLGEQHEPETHLIPVLLNAGITGKPFTIFGGNHETPDGSCVRDYLHVLDIADAHLRALQHIMDGNPSDYFNLGTGKGTSVREMIDAVQKVCDLKLNVRTANMRAGDPPMLVANGSKARDILGWEPHNSQLDFILKSALRYMLDKREK